MCHRDLAEPVEDPFGGRWLRKVRPAMIATESQKDAFVATVFFGGAPDVFSSEFHVRVRFELVRIQLPGQPLPVFPTKSVGTQKSRKPGATKS
jgi:hypothetical protein